MFIIPTICMSTVLLADVLIEDVLPESAIAVVSIENAKSFSKNFEELGMCNAMCEFADLFSSGEGGDESSGIADLYERWLDLAGLEEEDVPDCPSGRVQAGVYPVVDFETGSLQIGVLAIAELGNSEWSSIIDDLDPFRDGKAALRMGNYLKWLIQGFEEGLDKDAVMADAAENYRKQWGNDKVLVS